MAHTASRSGSPARLSTRGTHATSAPIAWAHRKTLSGIQRSPSASTTSRRIGPGAGADFVPPTFAAVGGGAAGALRGGGAGRSRDACAGTGAGDFGFATAGFGWGWGWGRGGAGGGSGRGGAEDSIVGIAGSIGAGGGGGVRSGTGASAGVSGRRPMVDSFLAPAMTPRATPFSIAPRVSEA